MVEVGGCFWGVRVNSYDDGPSKISKYQLDVPWVYQQIVYFVAEERGQFVFGVSE